MLVRLVLPSSTPTASYLTSRILEHFFGCGYRQVEGIVRALSKRIKELKR